MRWNQWSDTWFFSYRLPGSSRTLTGLAAYQAAIQHHYFALIILDFGDTAATDQALTADIRDLSRHRRAALLGQVRGRPVHRLGLPANSYVRLLLRLGIRDVTAGFKLWRTSALEAVDLAGIRSNGYSFQVEMNHRMVACGLKVVELPIHFADRQEGQSKMTLRVQLESALMPFVLRYRSRR